MARHALPLLLAVVLALAALTQPPFVGAARDQAQTVARNAAVTYAALRTINAAISTLKETEVSLPIVGGLGAKPGMALDPIDETVARVADILFLLMATTAVLTIAFGPIATAGAVIACAGFLALWLARRYPMWRGAAPMGQRAAIFGLLFALVLPVSWAGGGWMAGRMTDDRLEAAMSSLRGAGGGGPLAAAPAPDAGAPAMSSPWWSFWSEPRGAAVADADGGWRSVINEYSERAETILGSSLDIIAVYVLRLFVFPAFAVAVLIYALRQAVRLLDRPG